MACYWRMEREGEEREQPLAPASERTGVTSSRIHEGKHLLGLSSWLTWSLTATLRHMLETCSLPTAEYEYVGANVTAREEKYPDRGRIKGRGTEVRREDAVSDIISGEFKVEGQSQSGELNSYMCYSAFCSSGFPFI